MSAHWEAGREGFEASLREGSVVPEEAVTVAVSLDGVMVPMKDGQRAETRERSRTAGRQTKGPAGYREAKLCDVVVLRRRGQASRHRGDGTHARGEEGDVEDDAGRGTRCCVGQAADLHVVTVADGARDNWRFLDALAPQATAVVDFFHATEQLKSALDACYGDNDSKGRAQFEKLRHVLRDDPEGSRRSFGR